MSIFRKLYSRLTGKCAHERCIYGTGMMGDGTLCLDCGLDTYGGMFPTAKIIANLEDIPTEELKKKWWPEMERARSLPTSNLRGGSF